jgi:sigma-E factor negative regulatory protein RseA
MTQKLENLSAWMDGEQQDSSLLTELSQHAELNDKWQRYHLIGQAMRKELPPELNLDLSDKIAAAIEQEPAILAPKPNTRLPFIGQIVPFFKQSGQMAIAASVAVAVIIGVQQLNQPEDAIPYSPVNSTSGLPLGGMSPVSLEQTRTTGRLDGQEQRRMINAYLNDHRLQLRLKANVKNDEPVAEDTNSEKEPQQ